MKKNPVAKFQNRFNKAVSFKNKKRELKKRGESYKEELTNYVPSDEE